MIENRLYFFKEADTAVESDVLEISKANLLILEVSGSGTFGIDVMVNVDSTELLWEDVLLSGLK